MSDKPMKSFSDRAIEILRAEYPDDMSDELFGEAIKRSDFIPLAKEADEAIERKQLLIDGMDKQRRLFAKQADDLQKDIERLTTLNQAKEELIELYEAKDMIVGIPADLIDAVLALRKRIKELEK